jgi:hypothetical protein
MRLIGVALAMAVVGLSAILWQQTGGNGSGAALPHLNSSPFQPKKTDIGGGPNQLEAPKKTRSPDSEPASEFANVADAGAGTPDKPKEPSKLATAVATPKLHLLVPAYFYPSGAGMRSWQRLMEAASRVQVVAIANPSSGPGEQQDPEYSHVIEAASDKGVKVIGYVNTGYGKRLLGDAKNEIDRWVYFYPTVAGFFFDQQSGNAQDVGYYLKLREYARSKIKDKEALVVTNPGTTCDEEYFIKAVSDVTCLFASFKGFEDFNPPVLLKRYSPSRFAAMPYHIPDGKAMRQVVKDVIQKRIGYVYVSDAVSGSNPWERLPAYWDDEVEAVRLAN